MYTGNTLNYFAKKTAANQRLFVCLQRFEVSIIFLAKALSIIA